MEIRKVEMQVAQSPQVFEKVTENVQRFTLEDLARQREMLYRQKEDVENRIAEIDKLEAEATKLK